MIDTVQTSKKAIELRRLGFSYGDIAGRLKVSKTSVSNWVKNVRLTEVEKNQLNRNIKMRMERGRMMASISVRAKKVFKEKVAYEKAEKDFAVFTKNPLFMLGLGLCWNGALKSGSNFQFMSSDATTLSIVAEWIEKYLSLPKKAVKYKLFIDSGSKNKGFEEKWAKILGIPATSFSGTAYISSRKGQKDKEYKGSLSIVISRIEVIRRVIAWQKLAIRYYG